MKIVLPCLLSAALALSLAGCKNQAIGSSEGSAQTSAETTVTTTAQTEASETVTTPPPPLTTVHVEKNLLEKTITDDEGNTLIEACMELPVLITDVPYAAAEAINGYFENLSDEWFNRLATETKQQVIDTMPLESEHFTVYTTDLSFEVTYNDKGVLSILQLEYINNGGVHPSSFRSSYTFDLETGSPLGILDIMNGTEEEIRAMVSDGFFAQIKANRSFFYEEAKKMISDGKAYDGFYLNDEAVVFYYQTYAIAPYASGYPEYSVPYTETDKFKLHL